MRITIRDNTIEIKPAMGVAKMTNAILSALLSLYIKAIKDNEALRQPIYDMFNGAASEMLQHIIPDSDLHPDITEEAIMQLENELLDKKLEEKKEE